MHAPSASRASTRELRHFAFTVGAAFALLALLAWWRGRGAALVLAVPGALLVVAGALAPARLGGVHRAWMALALAISRVTTPLFMAVVYFVVLTPVGLVMRLCGRRPLGRARHGESAWVERAEGARRGDLRRQF